MFILYLLFQPYLFQSVYEASQFTLFEFHNNLSSNYIHYILVFKVYSIWIWHAWYLLKNEILCVQNFIERVYITCNNVYWGDVFRESFKFLSHKIQQRYWFPGSKISWQKKSEPIFRHPITLTHTHQYTIYVNWRRRRMLCSFNVCLSMSMDYSYTYWCDCVHWRDLCVQNIKFSDRLWITIEISHIKSLSNYKEFPITPNCHQASYWLKSNFLRILLKVEFLLIPARYNSFSLRIYTLNSCTISHHFTKGRIIRRT